LERVSDLAEHIAKRAKKLMRLNALSPLNPALEELVQAALAQIRGAVQSLRNEDAAEARVVLGAERGVNRLRTRAIRALRESIRLDPENVDVWLALINSARNLERVGDHAANLAENVIYLKEGEIIRHTGVGRATKPSFPTKILEYPEDPRGETEV
jgi:phosphate transport system protein